MALMHSHLITATFRKSAFSKMERQFDLNT
jgi:hypothetical protein